MADKKGAKVEGYKLTPEQKGFQKRYRALQQMRLMLEAATFQEKAKFQNIQEMWKQLEGQFQMLQQNTPAEPTQELSGMNFAPDMNIKY